MTWRDGRGRHGARIHDAVPENFGRNVTIPGALSCQGLEAVMSVDGATDSAVFQAHVTQVLVPTLAPGDIVIMDNPSAHKVAGVNEVIEAPGARLHYLPPYSSDLSPIEHCGSKLKVILRKVKARTRDALNDALTHGFERITAADAAGCFTHCGYALY